MSSVLALGLVVTALTAGCARLAWVRADTDPAVADRDLEDCRQLARLHAFRFGSLAGPTTPSVVVDPGRPGATVLAPSTLPARDAVLEQEMTSTCMRNKGYELVRLP